MIIQDWYTKYKPYLLLFLSSVIGLYAELLLIRWIPTNIRIFAYYSNLLLISALFGLGLGMILPTQTVKKINSKLALIMLVLFIIISISGLSAENLIPLNTSDFFIWNGLSRMSMVSQFFPYFLLILIFLLSNSFFILIGKKIAITFEKLNSNTAYSTNLIGSLFGILIFSVLSAISTPPWVWVLFLSLLIATLILLEEKTIITGLINNQLPLIILSSIVVIVFFQNSLKINTIWSPYYEISYRPIEYEGEPIGYDITVNQDSHQQALDFSKEDKFEFIKSRKSLYQLPYTIYEKAPQSVLILGSGTGNDVSVALQNNAAHINAVEIDPEILALGSLHPQDPYKNNKVVSTINDARAFIEYDKDTYDVIVYGFLDSHKLFSSMSSVRLENYLYTKETLTKLRDRINENGILVITYTVHEKWIADKIFSLLKTTFGQDPIVYQGNRDAWGTSFIVYKDPTQNQKQQYISAADLERITNSSTGYTWSYQNDISGYINPNIFVETTIPTDNWPHLFMNGQKLPINYVAVLLLVLLFSGTVTAIKLPLKNIANRTSLIAILLGIGFALVETKGISEIALIIGSTWYTNVIIIGSIISMALIANLIVRKNYKINEKLISSIIIALILTNLIPNANLINLGINYYLVALISILKISLPIMFSGLIFSKLLQSSKNSTTILGLNLFGSMLGGVIEYMSLLGGFYILNIIAICIYISILILIKKTD